MSAHAANPAAEPAMESTALKVPETTAAPEVTEVIPVTKRDTEEEATTRIIVRVVVGGRVRIVVVRIVSITNNYRRTATTYTDPPRCRCRRGCRRDN